MGINPVQAIMGGFNPMQMMGGQNPMQTGGGPLGAMSAVMQQAQMLAGRLMNPQNMIQQCFPNAPEEVRNDPDTMVNWLQQTGMYTPQQVQMARNILGRR